VNLAVVGDVVFFVPRNFVILAEEDEKAVISGGNTSSTSFR
jgi:hypothetical protein